MKKFVLFLICFPFLFLAGLQISFYVESYLSQPEFRKRADILIECISKYKEENGIYPDEDSRQELNCVPDAIVQSNEMLNSESIAGKGAFILIELSGGERVLVIGNWYPQNLIYHFNSKQCEENSTLFSDSL